MFKKKFNPELDFEWKVILCMAKIPLDYSDAICDRLLQSIYIGLTGASTCPWNGQHWISIGF